VAFSSDHWRSTLPTRQVSGRCPGQNCRSSPLAFNDRCARSPPIRSTALNDSDQPELDIESNKISARHQSHSNRPDLSTACSRSPGQTGGAEQRSSGRKKSDRCLSPRRGRVIGRSRPERAAQGSPKGRRRGARLRRRSAAKRDQPSGKGFPARCKLNQRPSSSTCCPSSATNS
jgi:hypothetical protein